jgi:hypothetical protein
MESLWLWLTVGDETINVTGEDDYFPVRIHFGIWDNTVPGDPIDLPGMFVTAVTEVTFS